MRIRRKRARSKSIHDDRRLAISEGPVFSLRAIAWAEAQRGCRPALKFYKILSIYPINEHLSNRSESNNFGT
jgi:hypothetical protein